MKIAFISPTVGEGFGQEKVLSQSCALLSAQGHGIYLLAEKRPPTPPPCNRLETFEGLTKIHWLSRPSIVNRFKRQILKTLQSIKPDIVHFIDQLDHRLMETVRRNYPTVFTAHTMAPTCPSSTRLLASGGGCTKESGFGCLLVHHKERCLSHLKTDLHRLHAIENHRRRVQVLKKFPAVFAISRYVETTLLNEGFERNRVFLVYNPIDVPAERLPLTPHDPPLFICASRLEKHKGIEQMIRAFGTLKHLRWELTVCGEGSQKAYLSDLVQRLGLSTRVHLPGRLSGVALRESLEKAFALVQTNLGPEPFGLSVAEASALGIPVIASNIEALTESLENRKNALLISPGDESAIAKAIKSLLEDPTLHKALGEKGPTHIEQRFSPQNHLEATLRGYHFVSTTYLSS